ncbi:MAG: biotin/lipoyl-containing protein, partial [Pirellulales bacterium]
MPIELKVPEVGESITEVMIGAWKKREGDAVSADEAIVEIES